MSKIDTSNFMKLIGVWKTSGKVYSVNETTNLSGQDIYELILNGNYILHKADVIMGNEKNETLELISLPKPTDKAQLQYFNSKGESAVMTGQINDNEFLINGEGIKFIGTINNQNTEIVGKWFLLTESENWIEFIELKLEKQ